MVFFVTYNSGFCCFLKYNLEKGSKASIRNVKGEAAPPRGDLLVPAVPSVRTSPNSRGLEPGTKPESGLRGRECRSGRTFALTASGRLGIGHHPHTHAPGHRPGALRRPRVDWKCVEAGRLYPRKFRVGLSHVIRDPARRPLRGFGEEWSLFTASLGRRLRPELRGEDGHGDVRAPLSSSQPSQHQCLHL